MPNLQGGGLDKHTVVQRGAVIFAAKSIFGIPSKSATFRNKYSKANVTLRIPWRVGGVVGGGNKNIKYH